MPPLPLDVPLPFTHGCETELQLVDASGKILRGEFLIKSWNALFGNARELLKGLKGSAPPEIRAKIVSINSTVKDRHGKKINYVSLKYRVGRGTVEVDCFGPDPNISQITWILELVTPPCESASELAWWLNQLLSVAQKSLPRGVAIVATGFNGTEKEYQSGVTFGDHHHIGIPDRAAKIAAYNLLRNYTPHLMALTVNSPFIDEVPTGTVVVKKGSKLKVLSKECTRSLRLKFNKGQMGPPDKDHYVPHLTRHDRKFFDREVLREPPDDRYVDIFPFTDYGTVELRFFDTQFSVARRVACALLIQAIAYKATKTMRGKVPGVKSEVLVNTREKAIEFGLVGKFFPDPSLPPDFSSAYNANIRTGRKVTRLVQAVEAMFEFLRPELTKLGFIPLLEPFFTTTFGTRTVEPPITPADYQLYRYKQAGEKYANLSRELVDISRKYGNDGSNDPIVDVFGAPITQFADDTGLDDMGVSGPATNVGAKPRRALEPVQDLKAGPTVDGSLRVASRELFPGELLKFNLELEVNSPPAKVLVGVKLVDNSNGRVETLQTAVKTFPLVQTHHTLNERSLPLKYEFGAFKGKRQCTVRVQVLDAERRELLNIESGRITAHGTPDVTIRPGSGFPRTVNFKQPFTVQYELANKTPRLNGKFKFKLIVLNPLNRPIYSDETDIRLKTRHSQSFRVSLQKVKRAGNEDSVKFRVQLLHGRTIVTEHTSKPIPVERVAVASPTEPMVAKRERRKKRGGKGPRAPTSQKPKVRVRTSVPNSISVKRTPPTPQVRGVSTNVKRNKQKQRRGIPSRPSKSPVTTVPSPRVKTPSGSRGTGTARIPSSRGVPPRATRSHSVPTPKVKVKVRRKSRSSQSAAIPAKVTPPRRPSAPSHKKPVPSTGKNRTSGTKTVHQRGVQRISRSTHTPSRGSTASTTSLGHRRVSTRSSGQVTRPSRRGVSRGRLKTTVSCTLPKTEFLVGEKVKYEFTLSKPDSTPTLEDCRFKVYYIAQTRGGQVQYLVNQGEVTIKNSRKIKGGFKIGTNLPPVARFKMACSIIEGEKTVVGHYETGECTFENRSPEKLVRIEKIENVSKGATRGQVLAPIVVVGTSGLVREEKLRFNLKLLEQGGTVVATESYEGIVTGTGKSRFVLPVACRGTTPGSSQVTLRLSARLSNYSPPPLVFQRDLKLRLSEGNGDLDLTFVGTKEKAFPVGSEALVWVQIKNNSPHTYKGGKLTIYFVPSGIAMFPVYNRKIQIYGNDNFVLTERLSLPLHLLGDEVFVYVEVPLKSKQARATAVLRGVSERGFKVLPPKRKPLEVKLETDRRSLEAHPNESIPVRIDLRKNLSIGALSYRLVGNYENVAKQVVAKGKVKSGEQYKLHELRWSVPRKVGTHYLKVEVFQDGQLLDASLVEQKVLEFRVTPTPTY
ncbi:MAG: glutamate-cysteine ligase family protein [Promethearchaeota archaeon]